MDSGSVKWKPITFTHVEYIEGDLLGKILAWSSLLPIFILVGFATHFYFRREIHTVTFGIGQVLNEALNFIIKHIVKESRPSNHKHSVVHNAYAWPSAHSQFIWFFVVYIILFIYIRSQTNNSLLDTLWKYSMLFIGLFVACSVSYGRIYLIYHTMAQVFWGAVIGSVNAVLWFLLTQILFTPLYPTITNWKISEALLIRDSSLIPNIMWFEYTTSRQESRSRLRKLPSKVQ